MRIKNPIYFILITLMFFTILSCKKEKIKASEKNNMEITDTVVFETNYGTFTVGLYGNAMPKTVNNFKIYISDNYYDGLIFHRIIPKFVIQGGGFYPGMKEKKTKPPIQLETSELIKHKKYILSMARTSYPHSATSQFFITLAPTPNLDSKKTIKKPNGYAAFGKVIEGFKVIDKISQVPTKRHGKHKDVPIDAIIIKKAYIKNEK